MKSVAILALAIAGAHAVPTRRAVDDATVLNFALTLEHLENTFYHEALAKFDEAAFEQAGLPKFARGRFQQVADHEKMHVEFLSTALGDKATKACTYSFPYTDPKSFAALSQVLEGVGVSAYAGAAQLITNKDYLTAAATVLSTEARHASWVASAVGKVAGWSGSFDVPLGINEVYSLAAPFIKECPSTNPALPVKAFPALAFPAGTKPGAKATPKFDKKASGEKYFAVFYTGLEKLFAPVADDGSVEVPQKLMGTVYAVISKDGQKATDDTIVAGPAVLEFNFDSHGRYVN